LGGGLIMPISISGSGTITGISAGGLPDDCITTADIAAGAVTDAKVNASAAIADSKLSGTTCKAFVNFNGTGTVAIRASYNVSSITDNGTGDYTVNFTTALADANYVLAGTVANTNAGFPPVIKSGSVAGAASNMTTSACQIVNVYAPSATSYDPTVQTLCFFR
jgi:hypothetical protein